ncbi:MAG TPA: T9SS type A sorting domain-containing protein, partial [Bacteroidia bacterium]|nr:T9SS type A sorting domain-containing protein [Bacteroidia bacterium]
YASDGKDTIKRVFGFYILDLPANTMPLLQPVTCNTIDIQPQGDSSLNWSKYKVEGLRLKITDSANKNVFNSATSRYHNAIFLNTLTPYAYSLTYTMRTGCTHTVTDSIYINKGVKSAITSSQNLQNPVNEWTQLDLQAQIAGSNGYTAFDYLWLPDSQRTRSITVYPVKDMHYTVAVKTPDGCENRVHANVKVTLTATHEINQTGIIISPNPATNYFSITGLPENASVQIRDIAGRNVALPVDTIYKRVDISGFAPGLYFITVVGQNFFERLKLIRE